MNPSSGLPYGQMPVPGGHRRHEMPFPPMLPNMRPQPGYPYYHSQMGPPMPPFSPHYPQQWYQYPHHMQHHPPAAPPRQYQHHPPPQHGGHYAPLVVSSYPQPHIPHSTAHVSPPSFAQQVPTPSALPSPAPVKEPFSPGAPSISSSTNIQAETPPSTASTPSELVSQTPAALPLPREPFYPPVPWLSSGDSGFPRRAPRRKRKVTRSSLSNEPIIFPLVVVDAAIEPITEDKKHDGEPKTVGEILAETQVDTVSVPDPIETPTPQMSDAPSDTGSTQPTTPSSAVPAQSIKSQQTPTQPKSRPVAPIIPAVPVLPTSPTLPRKQHRDSIISLTSKLSVPNDSTEREMERRPSDGSAAPVTELSPTDSEHTSKPASPPAPPKSWADLVRSGAPPPVFGNASSPAHLPNGLGVPKSESLSDVLNTMGSDVGRPASKTAFLQPRGLVNNGNTCYMNSVLQILIFCVPFYNFLDKIAQKATHQFKSDTPVIDAMILFMREFKVIDAASVDQLRLRLKPDDFENFGEPFTPEYVYAAIRELPRFRDMHRGHQQDAQEFLGFLLEELHEECAHAMKSGSSVNSITSGTSTPVGSTSNTSEIASADDGWMEVGHKQKPAITRSSGTILTESPVTKIFGGKLRSELKVAGSKNSVTLEPYQPLQLDIGAPHVSNIVDALKGLTRSENMHGEFQSPRGQQSTATKQVFIETLPPVLILHLKRFHYDSTTKRTEKIWKKVGYPLELAIPKEVFPIQTRNKIIAHGGLPRYRLTGVIYHHGKTANLGHYTVDIRRQDGREWIRLDDTTIRRVRSEEVAEAGGEEDPKVLAAALEKHNSQRTSGANIFEQINQDADDEEDDSRPSNSWNQVNGHSRSKSTMSTRVNGTSTPLKLPSGHQTPNPKNSMKDNKVAYLLFYERI